MKMIVLKNGAKEPEPSVVVITTNLRLLLNSASGAIALYELAQLCKDEKHRLFGTTGKILEQFRLIENGYVHDTTRNIVLSSVEGEGLQMRLVSPIKPPSKPKNK